MFKKIFFIMLVFISTTAIAADIPAPKIAVLNVQKILRESTAAKDATKKIESKKDQYQKQISKEENDLKKSQDDLIKQKNILSKEAFAEKQKAFVKDFNQLRGNAQKKMVSLDNAFKQVNKEIHVAMEKIVEEMAQEKGFNLVLPTLSLIYAEAGMDITDEVLTRLNKKLPKASVNF